jgi:hypothetical protein
MAEETIGTIFTKEEADLNYGSVLSSVHINSSELLSLINQPGKYLMFNIKDGSLSILGDGRASLYPASFTPEPADVYAVYSKSKIEELLNTGEATVTIIEQRKDVLSITNGTQTLETSGWCPPFCS